MIHCIHPYRQDKNLGKAYNDAFKMCPEEDWLCLMDWDVMLLTHDAIAIMEAYVKEYPMTGIFTCWTNRIHKGAKDQLWGENHMYDDVDIKNHIDVASWHRSTEPDITKIDHHISGMLMLISKKTWHNHKFNESGRCLGVDNEYSDRILESGLDIFRMNKIYVFHIYRLMQGTKDKSHLL